MNGSPAEGVTESQFDEYAALLARVAVALEYQAVAAVLPTLPIETRERVSRDIVEFAYGGTLAAGGRPGTTQAVRIQFKGLRPGAVLPTKAYEHDAGWDLYVPKDVAPPQISVKPGEDLYLNLGFATAIPPGYAVYVMPRSSTQMNVYHGLIDSGYRGEWRLHLRNLGSKIAVFNAGDRIAQAFVIELLPTEWVEVSDLPPSERTGEGFGSTGK